MPDRRSHPSNGRVVHARFAAGAPGLVAVEPVRTRVAATVADLCAEPGGARDRQLLHGRGFDVLETVDGWAFGQAVQDGYCGWIDAAQLADHVAPTHRVTARSSHLYTAPSIKAREVIALSMGSLLRVGAASDGFVAVSGGFVPAAHVDAIDRHASDPVEAAQAYLGAPYLWGGNSAFGIDCSGLVQAAFLACGRACPGDSDQQERWFLDHGTRVDGDPSRGDLVFWKGHVALVAGENLLLHANAHAMAVAFEPMDQAIRRIEAQGEGTPRCILRPA